MKLWVDRNLNVLKRLGSQSSVPLALAVVPLEAVPELFNGLRTSVLMHGTDHRNRARPGEKKTEFAPSPPDGPTGSAWTNFTVSTYWFQMVSASAADASQETLPS